MSIPRALEELRVARFRAYPRTLDCVHCGLCLSSCPTYRVTGREADSPRGRIQLLRGVAEEGRPLSREAETRILECIACRGCESVCPSGVRMGEIVEEFRADLRKHRGCRSLGDLLLALALRGLLPHRERIRYLTDLLYLYQVTGLSRLVRAVLRRVAPSLARLERLLPAIPPPALRRIETDRTRPEGYPARGRARLRAGLFLGCIPSEWFAPTHASTIEVLRRNGVDVVVPDEQTCCGALHRHTGYLEEARTLERRNAEAFASRGVDVVLVNAAGCGASLREPVPGGGGGLGLPVRDICEFLDEVGIEAPTGEIPRRVAYHQPCHLVHAQKIGPGAVERILSLVPGIRWVALEDSDLCCGMGGVYTAFHPRIADKVLAEKLARVRESGAEILVTGNAGCLLQLRSGLEELGVELLHPVDLLARAYGAPPGG